MGNEWPMQDEESELGKPMGSAWPIAIAVKEDEELIITGRGIILPRTSSTVLRKLGKRPDLVDLVNRIIAEHFSYIDGSFLGDEISKSLLKKICRVLSRGNTKKKITAEKWDEYYGEDGEAWNYRTLK